MRLLILTVSLWALASAKPEMYREKEDFQYSRSSSDEGSKHGYYGAQRGNMGGNFEKAHNMDGLAQHQMSTLVRQVDGELGDGANTRTGSVFTAGNSRGIFGSGHYDLSNLKGRNFDEGASFDNSQSQSSLLSSQGSGYSDNLYSSANNARYSASQLRSLGYNSAHQSSGLASQHVSQIDNQQIGDHYSGSDYEHGAHGASQYKYYLRSANQARSEYDQSNSNLYDQSNYDANTRSKFISRTPVRLYVRPGTIVTVPIAAQTYNAAQSSLVQDQNAANTETELVSNSGQRINVVKPAEKPKHFESSYSYHKEWEKHDTQPAIVIPTENPFPKNSELYDDTQLSQNAEENYEGEVASTNAQSNSVNSAYSRNVNSGFSSKYSSNTKTAATNRLQHQSLTQGSSSSANSNLYTAGLHSSDASSNVDGLIDTANSRPKSYQSSYSYHKSWERRGDPYIIQPVGDASSSQTSQRLVAASADKNSYSSNHYGSRYSQLCQTYVNPCNVEDIQNIRRRRSYSTDQYQQQMFQRYQQSVNGWGSDLGQQSQNNWDELENLGQQPQRQWGNLGQETQSNWDELGQQSQSQLGNLEDLGQQTQNHWDNLESLNQQLTDTGDINQHSQSQLNHLEDLGQQTQNKWDSIENFNQQSQGSLGDLTQQTQNQLNLEYVGQQTQNQWGHLEDLGQQTQSQWDKLENLGQQTQTNWDKLEELRPHIPETDSQQTQNTWNGIEDQHISTIEEQKQNGNIEQFEQQSIGDDLDKTTNFYNTQQNYNLYQHNQGTHSIYQENNFMFTEQNQNKWDDQSNRDAFHHHNTNPWDNIFQESIPNQSLNNPTTGNSEPNFWEKVDEMISESDKKNENVDKDKFLNPHTPRENWETDGNDRNMNNQFNNFNQPIDTEKSKEEKNSPNESNNKVETNYIDDKKIENDKSKTTEEESKSTETEGILTVHKDNPIDVGRGDIGPDEIPTLSIESTEKSNNKNKSEDTLNSFGLNRPYKTQKEIEALSLINENINEGKPKQEPTIINGFEHQQTTSSTNKPTVNDEGTLVYNPLYISPINAHSKPEYEHQQTTSLINKPTVDDDGILVYNPLYISPLNSDSKPKYEHQQTTSSTNKPTADDDGTLVYNPLYISPLNNDSKPKFEHNNNQVHENIEQQNLNHEVEFLGQEINNNYDQSLVDFGQQQASMNSDLQFFHQHELNKFETGVRHVPENENVQNQAAYEDQNQEPINGNQIRNNNIGDLQSLPVNQYQTVVQAPARYNEPLYSQQELSDFSTDFTHGQESEKIQKQIPYTQNEESLNVKPLNVEQLSKHNMENVQFVSKNQDTIETPVEPTEKPGFWKSLWGKTVNAKDKVASWFKSKETNLD